MMGPLKSIPCPVHYHAGRHPDGPALRDAQVSWSYRELEARITQCAGDLRSFGIAQEDRVAILAANSLDYAVSLFALYRIGACAVPLSLRQRFTWWADAVLAAKCKLILSDRKRHDDVKKLKIPSLLIDEFEADPQSVVCEDRCLVRADAVTTIIFTSGSTASPRGAILTFQNHYRNAQGSNSNLPLEPGNCWLAVLPFYHVGGLAILYRCAIAGSTVHIMEKFDAGAANELIDEGEVSHVSLVPTMLEELLSTRKGRKFPKSLRAILLGGGPVPTRLLKEIVELPAPVLTTYGMTETASQITALSPHDPPEVLKSSGRALTHCEVRIVDSKGDPVMTGRTGEIAVRGEILFSGYLGEGKGREVDDEGWFRTGDIGRLDDRNYLYIEGRKDDMFVSGGENIHPAVIEDAAMEAPGVIECAVVAVDSRRWGKRPVLFVRVRKDAFPGTSTIREHLDARLPPIMVPDKILLVDELPKGSIGKVDKEKLQSLYLDGIG